MNMVSTPSPSSSLAQQLADLIGADAIFPPQGYAVDGMDPQTVAKPADRQELAQLLRWASRRKARLFFRGGGVLTDLGNRPAGVDVVVDLSGLNRILDYQPADLTVTTEAGARLADLRAELAQGGKFVPLEAPFPHRATVGGIVAAAFTGPMRSAYGLPRDWLIGIAVAGADGVETKAGGRVVKNVTGYDLNKLYSGSFGALGVIVEASFKLAPLPETYAAIAAGFASLDLAIKASRRLTSQTYAPQGLQVVNQKVASKLGGPLSVELPAGVIAFVAGRPRAVARRLSDSAQLLQQEGAAALDTLDGTTSAKLLTSLTDLPWNPNDYPSLSARVNLPPRNVGRLLATLERDGVANGNSADAIVGLGIIADPGFGQAQLLRWPGGEGDGAREKKNPPAMPPLAAISAEIESFRRAAHSLGGTAAVEICPPEFKADSDIWEGVAGPAELTLMRRIKQSFDPYGILNPGRFIGKL